MSEREKASGVCVCVFMCVSVRECLVCCVRERASGVLCETRERASGVLCETERESLRCVV